MTKDYTVRRYEATDFAIWNDFVSKAKNATFLFDRNFMDYHSDRFDDFSLVVFDGEKLAAIMPAHRINNELRSHNGLTYGGIAIDRSIRLSAYLAIVKALLKFAEQAGLSHVFLKGIPSIYCSLPADEWLYSMFLTDAKLISRETLSVVEPANVHISADRKRGIANGRAAQIIVREETTFDRFWEEILIPNLQQKYGADPVHSAAEMTLLHKRFPRNIRQFNVFDDGKIVAGATIFESANVAHAQYIASDEQRNILGSVDFLFGHLLSKVFQHKKYFDFGTSNEKGGKVLNRGLSYWKETFGARTIVQDGYEILTKNYSNLSGQYD